MAFEDFVGEEHRDKEDLKTETDVGNKKSDILMLKKRKLGVHHRHLIVKKTGEVTGSDCFIIGHSAYGIIGTNKLGNADYDKTFDETLRVVNPNRTYVDNLHSDRFKDTTSTAVWNTTTGEVIF